MWKIPFSFFCVFAAVCAPLYAAVSINGPDTICRLFLRHAEMNPELIATPDFTRGFLRRFRSVVPRGNFQKIDKALKQADATDTMVLAFIGGTEVVRASLVVHSEYLEADNAHHYEARGRFQNILFSSSLAASLLIWGAFKIHGFTLDPYVSQLSQLVGLGLLSMGGAVALARRVFGPSYHVFLERVIDSLYRPNRPPLYFGHTISGTDRRAQYAVDIIFAHSAVPAMAQRDVFEDMPDDTPVMLVIVRPK